MEEPPKRDWKAEAALRKAARDAMKAGDRVQLDDVGNTLTCTLGIVTRRTAKFIMIQPVEATNTRFASLEGLVITTNPQWDKPVGPEIRVGNTQDRLRVAKEHYNP
jgi:hypothetical protein